MLDFQKSTIIENNTSIQGRNYNIAHSNTIEKNIWFNIGGQLGKLIGTVGIDGKPTENSYPLDRVANYIYNSMGAMLSYIKNIPNVFFKKPNSVCESIEFFNLVQSVSDEVLLAVFDESIEKIKKCEVSPHDRQNEYELAKKWVGYRGSKKFQNFKKYYDKHNLELERSIFCNEASYIIHYVNELELSSSLCLSKIQNDNKFILYEIEKQKQVLSEIILKEYDYARKINKPFLLLLGETHYKTNALLNEINILDIAKNTLKINSVFTEVFSSRIYEDGHILDPYTDTKMEMLNNAKLFDEIIEKMKLERYSMDFSACNLTQELLDLEDLPSECQGKTENIEQVKDLTIKSINIRNKVMSNELEKYNKSTVAIVGSLHLHGMIYKEKLAERYHIFPIIVHTLLQCNENFPCIEVFNRLQKENHIEDFVSLMTKDQEKYIEIQELEEALCFSQCGNSVLFTPKFNEVLKPGLGRLRHVLDTITTEKSQFKL